jgi:hypothetical protein
METAVALGNQPYAILAQLPDGRFTPFIIPEIDAR